MKKINIFLLIILFTSIFFNIYLFDKISKSNKQQISKSINNSSVSKTSEKNTKANILYNETISLSKENQKFDETTNISDKDGKFDETINVINNKNQSNDNLQKELNDAKDTISKLNNTIVELEDNIKSFKIFYENDIRDNFIIVDDSKIISFRKTP